MASPAVAGTLGSPVASAAPTPDDNSLRLPRQGLPHATVLRLLEEAKREDADWKRGRSWSLVYHLDDQHEAFLQRAYGLYFAENGLSPTAFPSLRRLEIEVVAMMLDLLNGPNGACGTMTSGGTESILLAVKAYREQARAVWPQIKRPRIIMPASAHPAFLKAGHYFNVEMKIVPVDGDYCADLNAVREAIDERTIALIASAPSYPQGVVDPIEAMAALAREHGIGLHVDACLGGFLLPFLERLGEPVPLFDFRVPGVTSISADLHKNGYTAKGASAILYRDPGLLGHQFFVTTDWPGGLYGSPTLTGTRPGGAIAAAWAALMAMGQDGYLEMAHQTMATARALMEGIAAIDSLHIIGRPAMSVFGFGSRGLDVFALAERMIRKGWRMDRQHRPDCVHMIATPHHAQAVAPFLNDLATCVYHERVAPSTRATLPGAMLYGQTAESLATGDPQATLRAQMVQGYRRPAVSALRGDPFTGAGESPDTAAVQQGFAKALSTRQQLAALASSGPATRLWKRPELLPLLADVELRFHGGLPLALQVPDGRQLRLDPSILASPTAAAFHLRHGLELALLSRLDINADPTAAALVRAALAALTALRYFELEPAQSRQASHAALPSWARVLRQLLRRERSAGAVVEALLGAAPFLLPLQGLDRELLQRASGAQITHARDLILKALPLAAPTEALLTSGGDTRIRIDGRTGLNRYGCRPRPRPWAITFSSCTASSISEPAYAEAEAERRRLLSQTLRSGLAAAVESRMHSTRRELARLLGLEGSGCEILFSASGTDIELLILHLALSGHRSPLRNLVISPNEVGGGTGPAAAGLHYETRTPLGTSVRRHTPVAGLESGRLCSESIEIRTADGNTIPAADLDARVTDRVTAAIASGERVLLHLLDSSKTGLCAPSIACARALQARFGDNLLVLVDAAQGRLAPASIRGYLASGFVVMLTASKFFTGPPFAGAMLLPVRLSRTLPALPPFPPGYHDYLTRCELPPRAARLGASLSRRVNPGLLLRWQAGLWEMKAFLAVPKVRQMAVLCRFRDAAIAIIRDNPDVELLPADAGQLAARPSPGGWDGVQTIFAFQVIGPRRNGTRHPLDLAQTRALYAGLNRDLSRLLPDSCTESERTTAARPCHVGQPVRVGSNRAALRVAAGARLVSGVHFDATLGADATERLAAELRDLGTLFRKISLIVRYWEELDGRKQPSSL